MNDSFTSASMRRETMRSRLFGAVMRRGLLGEIRPVHSIGNIHLRGDVSNPEKGV
jgi:hypothetical protein